MKTKRKSFEEQSTDRIEQLKIEEAIYSSIPDGSKVPNILVSLLKIASEMMYEMNTDYICPHGYSDELDCPDCGH